VIVSNSLLVVVGAGPGVGAAVARRFGRDGYDAALISHDAGRLEALGKALQDEGITAGWTAADVADEAALRAAVTRFASRENRIDVLHFNPSAFRQRDPIALSVDDLLADVRVGVGGLLVAVQAARPFLSAGARITATGSMAADRPWHQAASLGVQKAALRNLVRSLDATLRGDGIRAVSLTVEGTLAPDDEDSAFHPAKVAEAIWAAAHQPEDSWRTEVPYPAR
jgi:NAD(P)-dependent dehydrogenase (short-subunit alcohol dehydrogenase family)